MTGGLIFPTASTAETTPSALPLIATAGALILPMASAALSAPSLIPSVPAFTAMTGGLIFPTASTAEATPSALPLIANLKEDFSIFLAIASTSADAASISSALTEMLTRLLA